MAFAESSLKGVSTIMKNPFQLSDYFYQTPFLQDMLNALEESIYIIDRNGRFVFINKAVEKFESIRNDDVYGKHINDVYEQNYSPTLDAIQTGRTVKQFENRYIINGKEFSQLAIAMPLFHDGEIVGGYSVQRDITSIKSMITENINLQHRPKNETEHRDSLSFNDLIGKHPDFVQCVDMARSAAQSESSVLLTGSTGSGKEVFAKCIHNHSARADMPFLAINCAAIPETLLESILFGTSKGSFTGAMEKSGIFEQAHGGTLFLDEINSMALSSQAKLLRVLEEKEVRPLGGESNIETDVRIISSSNVPPREAINQNLIREDLFYRLSVVDIAIPSLRDRREDIMHLAKYFIEKYNQHLHKSVFGLDDDAYGFFIEYSWPGNVRQLKHAIESAMTFVSPHDQVITLAHLPQYLLKDEGEIEIVVNSISSDLGQGSFKSAQPKKEALNTSNIFSTIDNMEIQQILDALLKTGGNVSKAAEDLGMHRQSLIYRMKKYNISKK